MSNSSKERDVIGPGAQDKEMFYKSMAQSLNQIEAGREDAVDHEAFQTLTTLTRCELQTYQMFVHVQLLL